MHPAVCMSNFIKINQSKVGFSSICSSKTKKITIFEKNIFSGVNFITALPSRNSYFQEHPILDMVFCLSRMFFIFSFFHFPYEFKIYGSTCHADVFPKEIIFSNQFFPTVTGPSETHYYCTETSKRVYRASLLKN